MSYWVLDEHKTPKLVDVLTWAKWFENGANRRVAIDEIGGRCVSTVFLGIDHSFGGQPPLLFETVIFGGLHDGLITRAATWDEAIKQHANAVDTALSEP